MVTKILVLVRVPLKKRASAAAEESNHEDDSKKRQVGQKNENDDANYAKKQINAEEIRLRKFQKAATEGKICEDSSRTDHGLLPRRNPKPRDDTTHDGAVDVQRQNTAVASEKRPPSNNDIDGTAEKKKPRKTGPKLKTKQKKFIDLTDVPPQLPILKSSKIRPYTSKYKGVYFDKSRKKWKAFISFGGKSNTIGLYENEEEAAVDYARAVFKYKT
eukprot:CAMPEP_0201687312 /NCGR_PEP_ID=MMETSP0578-20130828/1435_1 /ASSEMBLY_ACC=CAM_ASM_000663 /TAXON_ID=267565 /ORGANISM="Skeletonema grethea, Strain CCMP 1804" /LENGTH=215 /DNA_ID=CAMNT_0048171461 /DNA_START=163 /DNA_END=810 /DNA_ORIENTATION=-